MDWWSVQREPQLNEFNKLLILTLLHPQEKKILFLRLQVRSYFFLLSDWLTEFLGLPENVEVAKQEIESHIAQRTGSASTLIDRDLDFAANGTDVLENGEEDTIM